jgi:hypothetical protein
MQRNLGAAVDISQAWPLVWSYVTRRFFSPTPRQLIELTAPQPFQYADYYNNYLQVAIVGMCFGALQPIILPVTAFYLGVEVAFKKYMVQYVFITKTESGGRFWRLLVNRLLFSVVLGNAVIALIVGAQGVGSINSVGNGNMLYAMIPLPFLLFAFKWYCKRAFDEKLVYYSIEPFSDVEVSERSEVLLPKRKDRVAVRFGHPALYKKLITPLVHAKSVHLLKEIYGHRSRADGNIFEAPHRRSTDRAMPTTPLGYSDIYMAEMNHDDPGQAVTHTEMPTVESVAEQDLDFENFKKREEFREQYGGEGELYGRPDDYLGRPGTPSTFATMTEIGIDGPSELRGDSNNSTRRSSATRLNTVEDQEQHFDQVSLVDPHGKEAVESSPCRAPTMTTPKGVNVDIPTSPLMGDETLIAGRRLGDAETNGHRLLRADSESEAGRGEGYFPGFTTQYDDHTTHDRLR